MELSKFEIEVIQKAEQRRENQYEFQQSGKKKDKGKSQTEVTKERKIMMARLGIDESKIQLGTRERRIIDKYVRVFQCNISWYSKKISKAIIRKNIFFFVGIVLLILIPVITFYFTSKNEGQFTPSLVGGIITVFLTIVLGLYKATAIWFESKRFEGLFWKASSDLKNRLYSLEDKWEEKVDAKTFEVFLDEVKSEILEGRKIVQEETQTFFENYATPILDVPGILSSSNSSAKSFFNAFQAPSFKRRLEEESTKLKNEIKLDDNIKSIKFLEKKQELLMARIARLSDMLKVENDSEKRKKIVTQKEVLENDLETSIYEIMTKKAENTMYE